MTRDGMPGIAPPIGDGYSAAQESRIHDEALPPDPASTSPPLIEAVAVGRRFGRQTVFRDVSMRIGPGQVHCLIGPNGAGKSTLLRMLGGLTDPTWGTVRVAGLAPSDRRSHELVGWVPPGDRSFYQRLSGRENLTFFARLHGLSRHEAGRRAALLLDRVGLGEAARVRIGLYSCGMQRRLAIARALITEPKVLLFDEATHDLDPTGAELVRTLVRELADGGAAAVWATQRLDELRDFADAVTVLGGGRARFCGPVDELVAQAAKRHYRLRLAERRHEVAPALESLRQLLPDVARIEHSVRGRDREFMLSLSGAAVLGDVLATLTAEGIQVLSCAEARSDVEQALRHLTGGPR